MWFEELPDQCPPANAEALNGDFYRLVEGVEVVCKDFWSHRKIWPSKKFNVSECRARSVSIFNSYDTCEKLTKLPLHRNKQVAKILLNSSCGVGKQTGREKTHFSWWRSDSFATSDASLESSAAKV